ncbi:ABC transporter permease [Rhizocola hellebori]|uniref:ABC transporter permease n=1 Tax=Rhizocola hellebori TaxID=1392758 RepID=A0A8J3Q886_9ACTN|nr:EamA family transporter [Rhizocola hellebori]GIH05177.1 ABC transporter permease [Rhizocola hellebori]
MRQSASLLTRYLTILAPVVWGTTYLVTTEFLPPGRPMFAGLARVLPAGIALMLIARGSLPKGDWVWRALILGTLNIGVFQALLFVAAYRLPGGIAAMVGSVQPLIVIGLSALALGTSIRLVHIGAAVLGTVGVVLLLARSAIHLDTIGVVAALAGALSMAAGIVLTKKWGRPVSLLVFTGWQLVAGGLVLLIPTLLIEGVPSRVTGTNLLAYTYLSLIGACLAYVIWFRGIELLAASAVSFLSLLSPVVATVLGFLVLGQGLTTWQLAGMAGIFVAIVAGQLPVQQRAKADGTRPRAPLPERVPSRTSS